MTRSYFDPYADPGITPGTSEEDIESYNQMVKEKKAQVGPDGRDESYLKIHEEIEARKAAAAEKEPNIGPISGLNHDELNEAYDQLPDYNLKEGQTAEFPQESPLEEQPEFSTEPVAEGMYEKEVDFEERTDHLQSEPSQRTLSMHPYFKKDRLDIPISDIEREIVGVLAKRWNAGSDIQNRKILQDTINDINANYPELAELYGGEDGIIQIEEVIKDGTFMSGKEGYRMGTVNNLMAEKFSRRLHALTKQEEWGTRENLVETGNRFNKGQAQMLKAIVSFPEHAWDTIRWNRVKAMSGPYAGMWIDRDTKKPYVPTTLNAFPELRDYNPWTQDTKWSGIMEWAGFHWLPAVVTGTVAPKGTFRWEGYKIPKGVPGFGLRSNWFGGSVRDSLIFLPGNILQQHEDAIHMGKGTFSPQLLEAAKISSAIDQDQALAQVRDLIPEFSEEAPLLANGWYQHPTIYRIGNILQAQGTEVLETLIFTKLGGAIIRPRRALQYLIPGQGKFWGKVVDPGDPISLNLEHFWKRQRAKQVDADMAWSQFAGDDNWLGTDALTSPNAGAYKLKNSLKQPGQARSLPVGKPAEVLNAANTKSIESPLGISGSTETLFTPLEIKKLIRNGLDETNLEKLSRDLVEDARYSGALRTIKRANRTIGQLFEEVLKRQQKVLGRDASKLTPAELFGPEVLNAEVSFKAFDNQDEVAKWYLNNIVSADNINSAIFTTLRDRAIGAKTVESGADIFSVDGPIKNIADNLVVGLTNVRRSRYLWKALGEAGRTGKLTKEALQEISAAADDAALEFSADSQNAVEMMMELVQHRNSDEVANGLLEMFSMSNDIHNWTDFNAFMKAKLFGGEFAGTTGDAVVLKEMQGVMMNSILSGPKTPMRALLGTTSNMYMNAINEAAGALIRAPFTDDIVSRRAALVKAKSFIEMIPESWQVLRRNISANWTGDIKTIKSRYHTQRGGKSTENWELFKAYGETQGNAGVQAAINVGDVSKNLNDNKWTTANIRIMAAVDDTAKWLLARARSKEKALRQILDEAGDDAVDITPEMLSKAQDIHYSHLLDAEGNINLNKDAWLRKQFEEVTLTEDIGKLGDALNKVFEVVPLAKPFYLFARSGVNGLKVSFKNTPGVSLLMDESRAILQHTGNDFTKLSKYGIDNAQDLANARNLFTGRQAVGSAVAMSIYHKYAAGELTGNGPADQQLKQTWWNRGWRPNTITFGDIVVDYSSLEPYNFMLSSIADIGDNMQLMGSDWAEKRVQAVGFVIGRGLTGKTYLSGLDQLMQMLQGRNIGKNIGNIMNNSLPLAGLRNEIGKFLNPHMKELNSSMWSSIRNRNQYLEPLARANPWLNPLVEKADILNGEPINDQNFIQRSFNMVSPIQLNIKSKSPGRKLLQQSNYDQNSTIYGYGGYNFSRSAEVRALFQSAMGKAQITVGNKTYRNLEHYLDELAKDPTIQSSVAQMRQDARNPANWDLNPNTAYSHNDRIDLGFEAARQQAWIAIQDKPVVQQLVYEQDSLKQQELNRRNQTDVLTQRDNLLKLNQPTRQ